jgi:hypothetical protein
MIKSVKTKFTYIWDCVSINDPANFSLSFILPLAPKINKWNKINSSIFPLTNCTSLVVFNGRLNNTLGLPRFTTFLRDMTYLNSKSLAVLIGLILGDAYFKIGKNNSNIRIGFKQSIINFPFFWTTFMELIHYCASVPRFEFAKLKGKFYGQLILETRTYPVFNKLASLFLVDGVKTIKEDLYHYLSPTSLAYRIMSDGVSSQYGLTICTDAFSIKEVICLINILIIRYDLDCTIHYYNKNPRIYIKANSMDKLIKIVSPFVIPFSSYKLRKGKRYTVSTRII